MKVLTRVLGCILGGFVLLADSAFSAIEHQGVLGGAFTGISTDASGHVVNQIGPIADFSVPIGLSAKAEKTPLFSGESSALRAALRLDDGTVTRLPDSVVEWSSNSERISIAGDLATAKVISKRARVSVQASVHGLTTVFFIKLNPGENPDSALEDSGLPSALADAVKLSQSGWRNSAWFGSFYAAGDKWILHQHHGWLYSAGSGQHSVWLWSPTQKWLWTGPGIYPHIYRNNDATWLYFIVQALPRKVYFNQSTKTIE
jgi:hypothetical protein